MSLAGRTCTRLFFFPIFLLTSAHFVFSYRGVTETCSVDESAERRAAEVQPQPPRQLTLEPPNDTETESRVILICFL